MRQLRSLLGLDSGGRGGNTNYNKIKRLRIKIIQCHQNVTIFFKKI